MQRQRTRADSMLATLTLSGLALYGLSRVLHDAFYRVLGTSVDEVGLDQVAVLGGALVALVGLMADLWWAVGAIVLSAAVTSLRAASQHRRVDSIPILFLERALLYTAAFVVLLFLGLSFGGTGTLAFGIILGTVVWFGDDIRVRAYHWIQARWGLRELLLWGLVVVLVVGGPIGASLAGEALGHQVRKGEPGRWVHRAIAQPPYLGSLIDSEAVERTVGLGDDTGFGYRCSRVLDDEPVRDDIDDYWILGQSDGLVVAWSPSRQMVLRAPTDRFVFAACGR